MEEDDIASTLLGAPIPGESLTAEMGAYPWQRPPELSTVDETISFYSNRIAEDKTSAGFVALMDSGISIKTLVDTMIDTSIMHGLHTIDVGTLVSPVLVEMFMYLAEVSDITYTTGLEEDNKNPVVEKAMAYKVMKEFSKKVKDVEAPKEEPEIPTELPAKGLMARPTPTLPMEEPVSEGAM